jgi:multisubunit Na+/H+ antiporter MnhC subunit
MAGAVEKELKKFGITVSKPVLTTICIIFGVLVIIFRDLLQVIIGLFLIIQGILLLTDYLELKKQPPP